MMRALDKSVLELNGIGEETAEQLKSLGIETIAELIEHYPFRYENYEVKDLHDIKHDERVTLVGIVQSEPSIRYYGKKRNRLSLRLLVNDTLITVIFFNRAFLKKQLTHGTEVTVTGKWDQQRMTVAGSECHIGSKESGQTLAPVYSVAGKLTSKAFKRLIYKALKQVGEQIPETLPENYLKSYKLPGKKRSDFSTALSSESRIAEARASPHCL